MISPLQIWILFQLPLSATQAPVTGLTDILTPVNLLPNSDFSRSGGYPATQTWEEHSETADYITSDWKFRSVGASLTNVTITRITNSIRFQATSSSSVTAIYAAFRSFTFEANKKYTMTGKMVGTAANGTMRIAVDASPNVIYFSEDGTTAVIYFTTTQTRNVIFFIDAPGAGNIDITCSDVAVYEGEFQNPPVTTSLDVKPGNQFALSNGSNIHIGSTDILSSVNKSIYEKSGNIRLNFDMRNNTLGTNVQIPIFYDYLNYAWKAMSVYLRIKFDEFGTYGRTYSRYYDAYYFIASNNPATGTQYEVKTITPGILQSIASSIDGGETTVGLRKLKWNNTNHETAILLTLSNIVYRSSGGIAINIDYQLFTQSGLDTTYIYSSLDWLSLS